MNYITNSFIPDSATFSDCGIYTNREIKDVMNEANLFFLMEEYNHRKAILTEGVDILQEEEQQKKSIKDKIISIFKTIFEKIKSFFGGLLTRIKNIFTKMKTEIFSKATKEEFKKAVDFFNSYDGKEVYFYTNENNKEEKKHYIGKKGFIEACDKYNKVALNRAQVMYNNLKDLYTKANFDKSKGAIWFGKAEADKANSMQLLNQSRKTQVFNYILFGNPEEEKEFSEEEMKESIFDTFANVTIDSKETPILSSKNLKNYAADIAETVYGDFGNKWTGTVKDGFNNLKKIIDEGMKSAQYLMYNKDNELSQMDKDLNNSSDGKAIGPRYAMDFTNRCTDIITVLVSIESHMNGFCGAIYKSTVKIVINILNNYWKLNKENRRVELSDKDLAGQPA